MTGTTPDRPSRSPTSSQNTASASGSPTSAELLLSDDSTTVNADDHARVLQALDDTQAEIIRLKDARREERIGWIVVCVILFNCAMLLNSSNLAGPLVIGIMEIAILAIAAKRLGVEEFYALFVGIMHRWGKMAMGGDD